MTKNTLYPLTISRLHTAEVGQLIQRTLTEVKEQKGLALKDPLIQQSFHDFEALCHCFKKAGAARPSGLRRSR